ncbi:glycerol kinase GlpK [Paeniglutamicibacter cryotolerans]|uniref:Glycerol kinase n=1 Tax=Paeniglutamicibacter cryotolerans TaxID=670079 RepID=A0A839QV26_9MICC|nr:glycerol kinase GlpK [Paeniglutamicibacter cryotolerans]MBB2997162.1 glycerol kinase [Paeniglutamicibacter cryotolerans]
MERYIIAIDQGTTSSRAIIFDAAARIVSVGQLEHEQYFPHPGWVEHDPVQIWENVRRVVGAALAKAQLTRTDIAAVGITNQRETAIVWDRHTGVPVHRAIVWQDTRTQDAVDALAADGGVGRFRQQTGLPLATYFSASKVAWILDQVPGARARAEAGDLLFGTPDSWVLWNLTGGPGSGVHATDVTNASRTLLMDLETLDWDAGLLELFGIPASMMPVIRSSSEVYGSVHASQLLAGVPVAGILGDQQAATFGQAAFSAGGAKNTYGTGCFLVVNTGTQIVRSNNGLLTTLAYRLGDAAPVYALEGSVAVAGSLVQWLRDSLGMISSAAQVEELAAQVQDNGGVYIVPAFSGLFAPYWRPDARGVIVGLTRYANRCHIARAALEATAFQVREVLDAVNADAGVSMEELRVDGGMVANEALMQFQADILGVPVIRPKVTETTALGAAYAAGLAVGFWESLEQLGEQWEEEKRWEPAMEAAEARKLLRLWKKAVTRTFDWVDEDVR